MIAQAIILAVAVGVFVSVAVLDRWLERRRLHREYLEALNRFSEQFRQVARVMGEALTPAMTAAAASIGAFGDALSEAFDSE